MPEGDQQQGGQQQGGQQQAAAPWHGYTEQADVDYVATKGWQGPQDAIKSYRGAEKLLGRDPSTLLVIPRADDPDGFRAVMSKLGLPESPDKYEFDTPKDMKVSDAYQTWARGTFHKLGLPANVVKQLTTEHNAFIRQQGEKAVKDYELNVATDKQALKDKWQGGFDRMMSRAQTAATALGLSRDLVDAIEKEVGYAKTYEMLADVGGKLGEDKLALGQDKNTFSGNMTPEEAKQQWNEKKLDKAFMTALGDKSHPGHKAAQDIQTKLHKIMFPA